MGTTKKPHREMTGSGLRDELLESLTVYWVVRKASFFR